MSVYRRCSNMAGSASRAPSVLSMPASWMVPSEERGGLDGAVRTARWAPAGGVNCRLFCLRLAYACRSLPGLGHASSKALLANGPTPPRTKPYAYVRTLAASPSVQLLRKVHARLLSNYATASLFCGMPIPSRNPPVSPCPNEVLLPARCCAVHRLRECARSHCSHTVNSWEPRSPCRTRGTTTQSSAPAKAVDLASLSSSPS